MLSSYTDKFCDLKDIKIRCAGRKNFVELKLILPEDIPISEGLKLFQMLKKY